MANNQIDLPPKGGFSFDLCKRNEMLVKKGVEAPKFRKTGTTIVGLVFKDGVILGADTRATEGPIVCDKNCEKIHYIAPNIYCCGAGTAADTEAVTDMVSSQLELHRYATGRESRVVSALTVLKFHLFGYQGYVSAALVLGGVDVTGPHLHTIYPHGSTDTLPFATMGSGSLAAMAMFESRYKERMNGPSLIFEEHLCFQCHQRINRISNGATKISSNQWKKVNRKLLKYGFRGWCLRDNLTREKHQLHSLTADFEGRIQGC